MANIALVSKYEKDESIYNRLISEYEELGKSQDLTTEKCIKLFESCRTQLQTIAPSLSSGAPLSEEQIKKTLSSLKADLQNKRHQFALYLLASLKSNILDPTIYKSFSHPLRLEIAKCYAEMEGNNLVEIINTYEIRDQNELYQLVRLGMLSPGIRSIMCKFNFESLDEQKRFELAKFLANSNLAEDVILSYYDKFHISDPNQAFEIIKLLAQMAPATLMMSPEGKNLLLQIKDPNQRFHLAEAATQNHKGKISDYLKELGITAADQVKTVYRLAYENSMKKLYLQGDKEFKSLSFPEHLGEKFLSTFKNWLDKASDFQTLIDYEKAEEKLQKIQVLLAELIKLGAAAGFPESQLQRLSDKVILKAESPQQQMKYLMWLGDLLIRCSFDPALKSLLHDEAALPTIEAIFKLTNPILQEKGMVALTAAYEDPEKRKTWLTLAQGRPAHLLLTALLLCQLGVEEKIGQKILNSLKAKKYTDYQLMQSINEMICFLVEKRSLSAQDTTRLLEIVLTEPEKKQRESAPTYQKRLEEYRANQEVFLVTVPLFVLFNRSEVLQNASDAASLLEKSNTLVGEIFGVQDTELKRKFYTVFSQSTRYPNGLIHYTTRLQMLPDEMKLPVNEILRQFTKAVLDGTFPQIRYDLSQNPHLELIFGKNLSLLEKWKTPAETKNILLPPWGKLQDGLIVEDTDQWEDLLLLGTEVPRSCQSITSEPHHNKCLLSYILDGKNRAMVVKNKEGKIVARSVIRILWDPQKEEPVLFMERLYGSQNNPELEQMVREGCMKKADSMGLPLVVANHIPFFTVWYPGELKALGGPVPYEYVDAAGGIRLGGQFTIPSSFVLYYPSNPI